MKVKDFVNKINEIGFNDETEIVFDMRNKDEETYNDKFRIYYDLEEQSFEYIRKNKLPKPYQVPLYILINTSDFRKFARENIENDYLIIFDMINQINKN